MHLITILLSLSADALLPGSGQLKDIHIERIGITEVKKA
ncbi:hypothetical protein ADILRU_2487 [Leifsonia rubra CMS 76R]|nr:hypothetical protein ADILRU_2487 [Leifsonia rubra CMS 76R]